MQKSLVSDLEVGHRRSGVPGFKEVGDVVSIDASIKRALDDKTRQAAQWLPDNIPCKGIQTVFTAI